MQFVVSELLQFKYFVILQISRHYTQWWHQRSKRARSFQGQKIVEPGHPNALFSSKKLTTFSLVATLKTQVANAVSPSK